MMRPFPSFCGSVLWNESLTWNTSVAGLPDITECMRYVVSSWVPCIFLVICSPFYLFFLLKSQSSMKVDRSRLNCVKQVLCLVLAVIPLLELSSYLTKSRQFGGAYVNVIAQVLSMVVACWFIRQYRQRGRVTSGVLFVFWFLFCMGSLIRLYSEVKYVSEHGHVRELVMFGTTCLTASVALCCFGCSCYSDLPPNLLEEFQNVCPEEIASFPSILTFQWFSPIIIKGFRGDMKESDLWVLPHGDRTESHVPEFERACEKEIERARQHRLQESANNVLTRRNSGGRSLNEGDDTDETRPLLTANEPKERSVDDLPKSKISLMRLYAKVYGYIILTAWLIEFVHIWVLFLAPVLQRELINFVSARGSQPYWWGYLFAVGFLFSGLVETILNQYMYYLGVRAGMRVYASLVHVIYKKALRMNHYARQTSTVGEIVNLMSVDASRINNVSGFAYMVWSGPFRVAVSLYFLYNTIGWSTFAGLAVALLTAPVQILLAAKQQKIDKQYMKLKDERTKLMSEILSGIKVIKLYAWEPSFEEKVQVVRQQELTMVRKDWFLWSCSNFIWNVVPFMIGLVTFIVYVVSSPDNFLSAEKAFVALSLFDILRMPFTFMPMAVGELIQALISSRRIARYLETPELDQTAVTLDANATQAISIKNGTFTWLPDSSPVLKKIDLDIPVGQLIAVVGQVGCGKSSLLSACIGDLQKLTGTVTVKADIAYVAQQAWIQNATVRDNILFGRDYVESEYNDCIEACALSSDLEILDEGDMTIIGEKGINLSGGQKQRVSLARAVYSQADIYLLDDPLSAVDSHVGKHIFNKVIGPGGLLQHRTRVLVTHGVQWLPYVDTIAAMTAGSVTEVGTYDELKDREGGAFDTFLRTRPVDSSGSSNSGGSSPIQISNKGKTDDKDTGTGDDDGDDNIDGGNDGGGSVGSAIRSRGCQMKLYGTVIPNRRRMSVSFSEDERYRRSPGSLKNLPMEGGADTLQESLRLNEPEPYNNRMPPANGSLPHSWGDHSVYSSSQTRGDNSKSEECDSPSSKSRVDSKLGTDKSNSARHSRATSARSRSDSSSSSKRKGYRRHRSSSTRLRENLGKQGGKAEVVQKVQSSKDVQQRIDDQEEVATGSISLAVYLVYLRALTIRLCIVCILSVICFSVINLGSSIWLGVWTGDHDIVMASEQSEGDSVGNWSAKGEARGRQYLYLAGYGAFGLFSALAMLIYSLTLAYANVLAAQTMHNKLLKAILRAVPSFFDTKPMGQILNRFSRDLDVLDGFLSWFVFQTLINLLSVITTLIGVSYSTPLFMIVIVPIAIIYYFIQKYFIPTTRQLQRLESKTRSPIYTHFSETLNGASTIRAYRHQDRFTTKSDTNMERNQVFYFARWSANRWLAIRLEAIASCVVFITALLSVVSLQYNIGSLSASFVGLAITYSLQSTNALNGFIRTLSSLEANAISVERVHEYSKVEQEAPWYQDPDNSLDKSKLPQANGVHGRHTVSEQKNHNGINDSEVTFSPVGSRRPTTESNGSNGSRCANIGSTFIDFLAADWPSRGEISFNRYCMRYRTELGLVLNKVSFNILSEEKVGIVGRTGAGKSSLAVSLFRMIEGCGGSITVDGIDISTIGLHQLRNRLTILPQDPVLFGGTLRSNLDPFSQYSDDLIWSSLDKSHLAGFVRQQPAGLDHDVGEGGQNLSVGQRQLLCLARSLLKKSKILILDEATAAVDPETDSLIQDTIREAFSDCTVLTVAHRLHTIMDSDRILVMEAGQVAEFDSPRNLLADSGTIFYGLAQDAGLV